MFGVDDPRDVLAPDKLREKAELLQSEHSRPFNIQKIQLQLDTARTSSNPFELAGGFRSIWIAEATDPTVQVNLTLHSRDVPAISGAIPMKMRDCFAMPSKVAKAYITHTAQAGKTVTIFIALDGEFRSGLTTSVNSGGVSLNDGASFTRTIVATNAGAPAVSLFPQDLNRKCGSFVNDTGADMWVGEAGITNAGATKGRLVSPLETFIWRNTAQLYAYTAAAQNIAIIEET